MRNSPLKMISVTQRHITEGRIGDCTLCPVALALKDAGYPNAVVFHDGSTLKRGGNLAYHGHGIELELWLENFDDGEDVDPITLVLENERLMGISELEEELLPW